MREILIICILVVCVAVAVVCVINRQFGEPRGENLAQAKVRLQAECPDGYIGLKQRDIHLCLQGYVISKDSEN